ncbi:MAG: TatD family hydrolase [Hyphomicrobiales bacterium]
MPTPPFIVDSHCHLDFLVLAENIDAVLERAHRASVGLMMTISTRVKAFERVLAIAEAHDSVYCTVGTHPHYANEERDVTADRLVALAEHPKVIGIGEAGLDYHYDKSPRDIQARSFRAHIAAARETGLPLVIHSRAAEGDTAAILEEEYAKGAFMPLLHCFSSDGSLARRALALGGYVSFSGIITFKNTEALRAAAYETPADRILVETDAPYLAPVPMRGKPNEPAFVAHTLARLAEIKGVSPETMAMRTSANFFRLFAKADPDRAEMGVKETKAHGP